MAFTAVTGVMMPRMASILSEKKYSEYGRLIKKSVAFLLIFSTPCILLIEIFAPQIVNLIAGNGYQGAVIPLRIIAPLILVIGFEQILITQSLMPMGKDTAVLINSILGAIVGLAANVILVPNLAAIGSAIAWTISELVVMLSALFFFLREWNKIKMNISHINYH